MALTKSITLPNGSTGAYLSMGLCRIDWAAKEASFHLHLYQDRATKVSAPMSPLRPVAAKLRLTGAKFDAYLGYASLSAAASPNHVAQAYQAFKAETALLISDFDMTALADVLETGQTA